MGRPHLQPANAWAPFSKRKTRFFLWQLGSDNISSTGQLVDYVAENIEYLEEKILRGMAQRASMIGATYRKMSKTKLEDNEERLSTTLEDMLPAVVPRY